LLHQIFPFWQDLIELMNGTLVMHSRAGTGTAPAVRSPDADLPAAVPGPGIDVEFAGSVPGERTTGS
jgi:hypothetical protein